jgi:hypothetical protein
VAYAVQPIVTVVSDPDFINLKLALALSPEVSPLRSAVAWLHLSCSLDSPLSLSLSLSRSRSRSRSLSHTLFLRGCFLVFWNSSTPHVRRQFNVPQRLVNLLERFVPNATQSPSTSSSAFTISFERMLSQADHGRSTDLFLAFQNFMKREQAINFLLILRTIRVSRP